MESGGNKTCVLALIRNDSSVTAGNDTAQLVFGHTDGSNDWPDGQTATLMPVRIIAEAVEEQGTGDDGHRLLFYTKDNNRNRTQTSEEAFRRLKIMEEYSSKMDTLTLLMLESRII